MITRKEFLNGGTTLTIKIGDFLKRNRSVAFTRDDIFKAFKRKEKGLKISDVDNALRNLKYQKRILHKKPYFIYK